MTTIIEQMLESYEIKNIEEEKNAIKEILQELMLSSLAKAGFFNEAVFCGGTALRIFYKLPRFSEDLDFALINPNNNYEIEPFLPKVKKSLKEYGLNIEIESNKNNKDKIVKSAFLKANTLEQLMYFNTSFDIKGVRKEEKIKIKLEIDTNPPSGAKYEYKVGLLPDIYQIKVYEPSSLFASKIHSILCRFWDSRVKGRDLYDFIFYVSRKTKVNVEFLENAMKQSGHLNKEESLDINKIKELLKKKFNDINYSLAKDDALPFIRNKAELDKWNKDLFISIVDMIEE